MKALRLVSALLSFGIALVVLIFPTSAYGLVTIGIANAKLEDGALEIGAVIAALGLSFVLALIACGVLVAGGSRGTVLRAGLGVVAIAASAVCVVATPLVAAADPDDVAGQVTVALLSGAVAGGAGWLVLSQRLPR